MPKLRSNEAYYSESDSRWHIYVQTNGVRRHFVSEKGVNGRKGKLQAERKADKWLETMLSDENVKVEILFDRWIDSLKERTGTEHWSQYEKYGRNWIKPAIGSKRMSALNENDLDRIIIAAYRHGLARKTLQNIRACIKAFLKYARKARITSLVAEDIIVPQNAPVKVKRVLSSAEIKTVFLDSETKYNRKNVEDFYINFYRFLIFEGLRPGELIGLRWTDINENGYEIRQAINMRNEITKGKNDNARRRHALSEYGRSIIEAQRALLRDRGIFSQYIFPSESGEPSVEQNIYRAWNRYCEFHGINKISLYELRHTNFSVNKEMPAAYKKMLFGHSEAFDGDFVYSHEMDGDLENAAAMNEKAFLGIINMLK